MNKHTPGPWAVDDNHGRRYIEPGSSDEPVAEVCKKKGGEYLANAHLIAAAPDLLAALEACESAMASCMADFNQYDQAAYDAARAAIARARGES
jgi:hypothetical protein